MKVINPEMRAFWEKAIMAPNGARIDNLTKGDAIHLRQRLYKARVWEKENLLEVSDISASPWDAFIIKVVPLNAGWSVVICRESLDQTKISTF